MKISALRSIPVGAVITFQVKDKVRKGILLTRAGRKYDPLVFVPKAGTYVVSGRDIKEVLHLPRI